MRATLIIATIATTMLLGLTAHPTQAATLPVQGVLRTTVGGPVADGEYVFFAKLYTEATATKYAWEDAIAGVKVRSGFFDLVLGANAAKPIADALLMSGGPLWIGIRIGSEPELPRQPLVAVPSAWYAHRAAVAAGVDCEGCVASKQLAAGAVTAEKAGFTYAASKSKGGAATAAEHATTADTAATAVSAESAKNAKTADVAADLLCTGCVKLAHLDAGVTGSWLSKTGGTVSGDLGVGGKLTAVGGLVLGNSTISGGQLEAGDIAKITCDAKIAGRISFDQPSGRLALCDGKVWRKLSFCSESCKPAGTVACGQPITDACGDSGGCTGKGTQCDGGKTCVAGSCALVGKSCAELHSKDAKAPSDVYLIDPDGPGGEPAFQTYCDMTSDGGGWTLLVRADGGAQTFKYDAALWTDNKVHNAGQAGTDTAEVKTLAAVTMPFTTLRIGLKTGNTASWATISQASTSLTKLLSGGAVSTSLGRNAWKALVPNGSAQPQCNMEGFNRACGSRLVRIGLLTNQESDCNSCDSYIGIGHSGADGCESQKGTICGMVASCSADNGARSVASWGYIYAR